VSEIVQNGSNQGAEALPSHSHEEFIEFCALSTSETLTPEEWARLHEHLKECASCRELKEQYDSLTSQAMPALAAGLTGSDHGQPFSSWSLDEAEARLMEKLGAEAALPDNNVTAPRWPSWWKHVGRFAVAALVLLACVGFIYRIVLHAKRKPGTAAPTVKVAVITAASISAAGPSSAGQDGAKRDREITQLRTELRLRLAELEQLKTENSQLESDLKQRAEDLEQSSRDRASLDQKVSASEYELRELQGKLDAATSKESHEAVQLDALQVEANGFHDTLEQKDREMTQDEDLLAHDRDIRDLMGARNLYIAEVYDLTKTGAMQKPFGRVFYTKDKSLIFYGYDLDQQPGLKKASTFQAWGASGTNDNNFSLGLFYRDDTNKKRWILKYNDAKTIAKFDRVFVTVEPEGGSMKPTSKPLLFTYLRIDPNHP
jgi:hypothetical protein